MEDTTRWMKKRKINPEKILDKGFLLYRRSNKEEFTPRALNWFALDSNYGSDDTYGSIKQEFEVIIPLKLYNISSMDARKMSGVSELLDPDEMYSGGVGNKTAHKKLLPYLTKMKYDGTYINDAEVTDEDLSGPTEVVLIESAVISSIRRI